MHFIILLISLTLLPTSNCWSSDSVIADSAELSNFQESTFIKMTETLEKLNIEPGNLFVGMAPRHKALEVISFNPNTSSSEKE